MRKRNSRILLVVAVVLLAGMAVVIIRKMTAKPPAPAVASAQVATVQLGSISHRLTLAGQFQAYQTVDVHPKVSGFIQDIYVDIGDRVHAGETLSVLEVPELHAQLGETVADLARSKDEVQRAEHEVTRAESLYAALNADNVRMQATAKTEPGLIAQQELDDVQAKALAAAAQVDSAKAALSGAQSAEAAAVADNERVSALWGYTKVIAPLDGVIIWRYADTGALIQSGRGTNDNALPIVKIAQSGLLRLRMPVPEDAVRYIHIGDQVNVHVAAIGRTFTGTVIRFTRSVNFETRTMETEVDVENRDLAIDTGMYATANFILAHADNVPVVPIGALVLNGDQEQVLVLDSSNHVRRRNVTVGVEGSQLAQIASGVAAGDRVILGGQNQYEVGEKVVPVMGPYTSVEMQRELNSEIDAASAEQGAAD